MNLAEFVEASLTQILSGIRSAQKKEGGGAIGAEFASGHAPHTQLVHAGTLGTFTVVEFDVSLVAANEAGGKGALRVWGVGVEGGGTRSNQQTSRVKFAVQVRIPEGDKGPDDHFEQLPPQQF